MESGHEERERNEMAVAIRSTPHTSRQVPVIDRMRKIVESKTASRIDGLLVDLFSASAVVQVHDALNEANRTKLAAMSVRRMVNVSFSLITKTKAP